MVVFLHNLHETDSHTIVMVDSHLSWPANLSATCEGHLKTILIFFSVLSVVRISKVNYNVTNGFWRQPSVTLSAQIFSGTRMRFHMDRRKLTKGVSEAIEKALTIHIDRSQSLECYVNENVRLDDISSAVLLLLPLPMMWLMWLACGVKPSGYFQRLLAAPLPLPK